MSFCGYFGRNPHDAAQKTLMGGAVFGFFFRFFVDNHTNMHGSLSAFQFIPKVLDWVGGQGCVHANQVLAFQVGEKNSLHKAGWSLIYTSFKYGNRYVVSVGSVWQQHIRWWWRRYSESSSNCKVAGSIQRCFPKPNQEDLVSKPNQTTAIWCRPGTSVAVMLQRSFSFGYGDVFGWRKDVLYQFFGLFPFFIIRTDKERQEMDW